MKDFVEGTFGGSIEKGDKLEGFRGLERFVRAVETQLKPNANFEAVIAYQNEISTSLAGRSVFDDKPRRREPGRRAQNTTRQQRLF